LLQRVTRQTYSYISERMQQKPASWKSKNLSLAGRITLCKPMLSAVPLYPMHSSLLPEATCNEIEKICRKFIRGENEGKERLHRVRWKTVWKSKQDGFLFLPISYHYRVFIPSNFILLSHINVVLFTFLMICIVPHVLGF
jgi:hypothetical protein